MIKAAEHHHADAECFIGWMYHYGEGVEKDFEKALMYYK